MGRGKTLKKGQESERNRVKGYTNFLGNEEILLRRDKKKEEEEEEARNRLLSIEEEEEEIRKGYSRGGEVKIAVGKWKRKIYLEEVTFGIGRKLGYEKKATIHIYVES